MTDGAQPHFITKLASELLSEVFVAYLELNYDTPLAQLLLIHICHSWRDVALNSTPRLWTILYMSFGLNVSDFDHQSMITTWLHRSVLPVNVRIEQKQPLRPLEPRRRVPQGVVTAMVSVSSRIRTLKIQGTVTSWTPLISLPSGSFPILTVLDLSIDQDQDEHPPKVFAFAKSPLRKLNWRWRDNDPMTWFGLASLGQQSGCFWDNFSFDNTRVTSLVLENRVSMTPGTSWNLLARFQHLVDCTLWFGFCDDYSGMVPLTHPDLTTFTLKSESEAALARSNALTLINAPCLTELHVEFMMSSIMGYDLDNPLASTLVDFSKRFHLTHLSLIRAHLILPKELPLIINAFSSLRSFTLIAKKIVPKTLLQSLLCKKTDEHSVLPYLEYLRFGRYTKRNSNALKPKQLLEVVESRWLEEKMNCFNIHSRLIKVQIDRVIDLTQGHHTFPFYFQSRSVVPPDPSALDPEDEWLARFNAAENSRLQRLQAEGFTIVEGTFYIQEEDLI